MFQSLRITLLWYQSQPTSQAQFILAVLSNEGIWAN